MRRVVILVLLAGLVSVLFPPVYLPAIADETDRECIEWDELTGICKAWASGTTRSEGSPPSSTKNVPPPPKCYGPITGKEIPCQTKDGYWSSIYHCYIKPYTGADAAQRAKDLDVDDDEMLAACTRVEGDKSERMQVIVIPRAEATPPPDPRTVAWQLIATINITAGRIGLVPTSEHAMVGLPTWLWVDNPGPRTTGPAAQSTSVRGYTITIEAELDHVVYTMGDGTTVTCSGANATGTPYLERYGIDPSPSCGHWYEQPGDYTVTARSVWTVTWHGVGQAGTITLDVQRSVNLAVAEGHAVTR